MYYVPVRTLAQAVHDYIRKQGLLKSGDRVAAAVSGGADSVAMLRLLLELRAELGIILSVAHFNHQLRGVDSDEDEQFVAGLARQHGLELHCERGDVRAEAAAKHLSLETAARKLRYGFFGKLLQGRLNRIATAHTLDDQAETVLLKLVRGAGSRGLAGIYPLLPVSSSRFSGREGKAIIRPLLGTLRQDLEAYLSGLEQDWREDQSNRDLRHARNRVRHGILPRLERHLNPGVRQALADTAEIARAEEQYWQGEVARALPLSGRLSLQALSALPLALRRRVIRAAAESAGMRLEFRHVQELLEMIAGDKRSASSVVLPGGTALRAQDELRFDPGSRGTTESDYEYRLRVPGSVNVPEAGTRFEAMLIGENTPEVYNPEHLLKAELLAPELRVRNWRPGDRFWPAHTKAPKKIKELLQERHVTGSQRKQWPVVVSGNDVVWLRGFPLSRRWQASAGARGVAIEEGPLRRVVPRGKTGGTRQP